MMKTPENLELVLRLVLLPTERVEVDLVLLVLFLLLILRNLHLRQQLRRLERQTGLDNTQSTFRKGVHVRGLEAALHQRVVQQQPGQVLRVLIRLLVLDLLQ